MVKVAVIGPGGIVSRVIEQGKNLTELSLIPIVYKNESEAIKIAMEIHESIDVVLFTGPIPYEIAKQNVQYLTSRLMYINYGGTGLYRVLFQMNKDGYIQQEGADNKLSIDFINKEEVIEAFEELELYYRHVKILELKQYMNSEKIVQFHLDLWKRGEVKGVITSLYSVYEKLKKLGIPVYCIIPTKSSILNSLQMALAYGREKSSNNNQIAVSLMTFENSDEKKKMLKIVSETLQTIGQQIENDTFLFYTTKGFLHKITNNFKQLPYFMSEKNSQISMGVGIGKTAKEAMVRSQLAHLKSSEDGINILYVVGDDNTVIRVDSLKEDLTRMVYQSRSYDEIIRKIASETHLSISTLSKIKYVSDSIKKDKLTGTELASQLNITERSSRRILKTLVDTGYAYVVGDEQPISRGRPRNVYKLLL